MDCKEPGCQRPARAGKRICRPCERAKYPDNLDPEKRRASWRAKNHRRRGLSRAAFDAVTPAHELELRRRAKRCPMPDCGVELTDEPYLPNSKELDHMVPRHVGGTHTVGNVRIICRRCNEQRPKDGSDFAGQPSLWAQDHEVVGTRTRGVCPCGTRRVHGRCPQCRPKRTTREADGIRAAEMRAAGADWQTIATEIATTPSSAGALARRYGGPAVVAAWPVLRCFLCGAELPTGVRGRPRKSCPGPCRPGAGAAQVDLSVDWEQGQVRAEPAPIAQATPSLVVRVYCPDCGDAVARPGRCAECRAEVSEGDAA